MTGKINLIDNEVKLVLWDLDDTLWQGTLAEDEIQFVPENVNVVIELAKRGIISSIVSKNDYSIAMDKISEIGLADFFVLPSISFESKGERIKDVIERIGLRSQNVLFIDDNIQNLEEAVFYSKDLMVAQPSLISALLDHPCLKGKEDCSLSRLNQYKILQKKWHHSGEVGHLSNEEFLRQSEIIIYLEHDLDQNFDRIIEIINRTNQLNYTKVRVQTSEEIFEFKNLLKSFGIYAALVGCKDKYGDYGFVGFICLEKKAKINRLIHFCFSCRTMNMGIERFLYQHLKSPQIEVAGDVAYSLQSDVYVNWIDLLENGLPNAAFQRVGKKTLLIGGCELLQLSSLIGGDVIEFTNNRSYKPINRSGTRYDDPFFIIASRATYREFEDSVCKISGWTFDDLTLVDESISSCDIIIISMVAGLRHIYIKGRGDIFIRQNAAELEEIISCNEDWFYENFVIKNLSVEERLSFTLQCLKTIESNSKSDARIFVMGADTRRLVNVIEYEKFTKYNVICDRFCSEHSERFVFVNVNEVVSIDNLIDASHYNRLGYLQIRNFMLSFSSR